MLGKVCLVVLLSRPRHRHLGFGFTARPLDSSLNNSDATPSPRNNLILLIDYCIVEAPNARLPIMQQRCIWIFAKNNVIGVGWSATSSSFSFFFQFFWIFSTFLFAARVCFGGLFERGGFAAFFFPRCFFTPTTTYVPTGTYLPTIRTYFTHFFSFFFHQPITTTTNENNW